jgi:hypothetical protein
MHVGHLSCVSRGRYVEACRRRLLPEVQMVAEFRDRAWVSGATFTAMRLPRLALPSPRQQGLAGY